MVLAGSLGAELFVQTYQLSHPSPGQGHMQCVSEVDPATLPRIAAAGSPGVHKVRNTAPRTTLVKQVVGPTGST